MKPHSARYAPKKAIVVCRAALQRGRLFNAGRFYRFGQRFFSCGTVNALIASGEAIRVSDGDVVRAA